MKAPSYRKRIRAACEAAGTYQECFDSVIDSLAMILQRRDEANEEYRKDPKPIVEYTNKGGATNRTKNPALVLWCDLNSQALAYWRDLGLTPAGLRKINEEMLRPVKQTSLGDLLSSLGKELSEDSV